MEAIFVVLGMIVVITHDHFPQAFRFLCYIFAIYAAIAAVYLAGQFLYSDPLLLFLILAGCILWFVVTLVQQEKVSDNDDTDTYSLCDPDESPDHRLPSDAEVSDIPIEDTYPLRMPSETSSQTPSNPQP